MAKQFIKLKQLGRFFMAPFTIVQMELLYVFFQISQLAVISLLLISLMLSEGYRDFFDILNQFVQFDLFQFYDA